MAISNRISGKGGSLIDNGVAALAALSAGFVTYAMPEALFARLITASHLPDFLAAAQPPLGMKARLAVIAVAILIVYAFVWTLLRALDGIGRKARPAASAEVVEEAAPPRLRRADAHPDAPSRRPIFAGRDLGEPGFDEEPLELELESALAAESAAEPEPQPAAVALPAFLVPQPEPEAEPDPVAAVDQADEFAEQPFHHASHESEEEAGEEEEAIESEGDDQSLTRLMQRFESGLGRKQQALEAAPPPAAEPEPVPQERVGHRLRSAISDLGKMSAPGR
jgi:hypothetical protein